MSEQRIHRTRSHDGTEIAGRVHGQGPPLVLVHGSLADGDTDWEAFLPLLAGRFTCYTPSTRCRGLSGSGADLSGEARVGDVAAFVDSIGEPVGLVGFSVGGALALGAAARSAAVASVAVYEPVTFEVMPDALRRRFQGVLARMRQAAAAGDPGDAAASFFKFVANDEELSVLSEAGDVDELARYLEVDLEELQHDVAAAGPSPTDPEVLQDIAVPALLLHGSRSAHAWFADGVRHAARHLPEAHVREIAGAGHLGPLTHPELVAGELVGFLESQLVRA